MHNILWCVIYRGFINTHVHIFNAASHLSLYNHNPIANQNIFGNNIQYRNCSFKMLLH